MQILARVAMIPALVLLACVVSALFGALQNQLSYTVSPEYFHGLKFDQFRIPDSAHSRWGAAWVGGLASWWMGLIIGIPVAIAGLGLPGVQLYIRRFVRAVFWVLGITTACALIALAFGYAYFNTEHLPPSVMARGLDDPLAFARAGIQHEGAYIGGVFGLLFAVVAMIAWTAKARKSR